MSFGLAFGLTEEDVDDQITAALAGLGSGDLAGVSLRRAAAGSMLITGTPTIYDAETVDLENDPTVLEAGPTTGEILIKDAGLHIILFEQEVNAPADSNYLVNGNILNNGVGVPGGFFNTPCFEDPSIPGSNVPGRVIHFFIGDLAVGTIRAELSATLVGGAAGTVTTASAGTFACVRLKGSKGDQGDPGPAASPPAAIELRNTDVATNLNQAAFTLAPVGGNEIYNLDGGFTSSGSVITALNTGHVWLAFSIYLVSAGARVALEGQVHQNGTPVGAIAAMGYIRNNNSHNHSSISNGRQLFACTAGDTFDVRLRRESTITTSTTMDGVGQSYLNLEYR